jgi:hypothetical protein
MQRRNRRSYYWIVLVALGAGVSSAACGAPVSASPDQQATPSAQVEPISGTGLSRVTLTARAAERLAVKTEPVREEQVAREGSTALRKVVPYAAVLYDTTSAAWVYTNPEPLVFVRHAIRIDFIDGDRAVLSEGPNAGTPVVSVGASELYGTELTDR